MILPTIVYEVVIFRWGKASVRETKSLGQDNFPVGAEPGPGLEPRPANPKAHTLPLQGTAVRVNEST